MRNKKMVCFLLSAALCVQSPVAVLAAEAPTYEQYRGGTDRQTGRSDADYTLLEISTEEELRELAENCILDSWSRDKKVVLTADIELTGTEPLCIPVFAGIFDGNDHSITGLKLTEMGSAVGLFRYVQEGARVQNLTVRGEIAPEGSQDQAGGIVGVNYGRISNCSFAGKISGNGEIGGIAGVNEETGEIRGCENSAAITGNHSAGGITGNNKGILNNCTNSGTVNTSGTEVTYGLDDFTAENLEQINSTSNVAAHTDTGGIAGISSGKIYYCSNEGTIGYQHVGYNTGGIVGRLHQGYLQNCTNSGYVLGRKDVGGIVGQMEPFLEVQYLSDKLSQLDRETDKFIDLMDAAYDDFSANADETTAIMKDISLYLQNANDAGKLLNTTATDLWYIYNQELNGISSDLKTLDNEWNQISNDSSGSNSGSSETNRISISGNDLFDGSVSGGDLIPSGWDDDAESYLAALRKFGSSTAGHMDTMTNASTGRIGTIGSSLDVLNKNLEAAFDELGQLSDSLEKGMDSMDANADALSAQARVLRKLVSEIRDDLFRYEGISVEDTSDEAASSEAVAPGDPDAEGAEEAETTEGADAAEEAKYDTSSFQKGKITLCVNRGTVEADANVGGIVGQIATEYDFDPEDDITLTGTESFDIEQTIKAVVRDSRNLGDVTGKKDCVGGIVGRAEFGAVISCESYGDIESTGGSEVGGIAGASSYAIRSCYSMGSVSGKNDVGGIAGKGCDIFYSYAYNEIELTGERQGAIAGMVSDDGTLYGNYYVAGGIGGVDGIGYEGGATPLSYEEFCSRQNVPEAFSRFRIVFQADGKEIASYECGYGEAMPVDQIPAVPEKDGCYGSWPEFDYDNITGNKILEAVYEEWMSSIAAGETSDSGRPLLMAKGDFYPETKLYLDRDGDNYTYSVKNSTSAGETAYTGELMLRVFCTDADNAQIEVEQNREFVAVDSEVVGSYREFKADAEGTFRVTESEQSGKLKIILPIAGGAAAALLLILIAVKAVKKKKRKKEKQSEEKE